jgi:hypothetical protein
MVRNGDGPSQVIEKIKGYGRFYNVIASCGSFFDPIFDSRQN